jgi:hypothetical protein
MPTALSLLMHITGQTYKLIYVMHVTRTEGIIGVCVCGLAGGNITEIHTSEWGCYTGRGDRRDKSAVIQTRKFLTLIKYLHCCALHLCGVLGVSWSTNMKRTKGVRLYAVTHYLHGPSVCSLKYVQTNGR